MNSAPHSWPDMLDLYHRWWQRDTPTGAVLFSVVMATLHMAHFCGGTRGTEGNAALWRLAEEFGSRIRTSSERWQ